VRTLFVTETRPPHFPMDFKLNSTYDPRGDQPEAIRQLVGGV
jgi:hypothetical protein